MEMGQFFIKDQTGEWMVYPGHPLVLACAIARVFPSFEEATKTTDSGWSQALGDCRIPGAGCHVGAAVQVLAMGRQGASVEDMIKRAGEIWVHGKAGGHERNVAAGVEQAKAIEPWFMREIEAWLRSDARSNASHGHATEAGA